MPNEDASPPGPTTPSGIRLDQEYEKAEEQRNNGEVGPVTDPGSNSGADGAAGQYTFTDLRELDAVIRAWRNEGDSIREDGTQFQLAAYEISAPTSDVVTTGYFATLSQAFSELTLHNYRMFEYNGNYVDNLSASRDATSDTDQSGAGQFPTA